MRGEHATLTFIGGPRWFIPACAGNTSSACDPRVSQPVHPRMRGEHLGSHVDAGRFIPACAGNTASVGAARSTGFIPACAGNTERSRSVGRGSSPHARGTHRADLPGLRDPVHPRMRGEHYQTGDCHPPAIGSSPHARGTHPGHKSDPDCAPRRVTLGAGTGSGVHQAMDRAQARAFSLSMMPGNRRRSSMAAEISPCSSKMARIAAASPSVTTNISAGWEGTSRRASKPFAKSSPRRHAHKSDAAMQDYHPACMGPSPCH